MPASPLPLQRKRGAQPGNLNSFKDGSHARRITPAGAVKLDRVTWQENLEELSVLRVAAARAMALWDWSLDFYPQLRVIRFCTNAFKAIGNIVFNLNSLFVHEAFIRALSDDIASALKEHGLDDSI
jgi:hypothetical protein